MKGIEMSHTRVVQGRISEIFSSIQGEGIYVGIPMIFIRFSGCNQRCSYCDTSFFEFEEMSIEAVVDRVKIQVSQGTKFISLTGGEPLLQAEFILELLPHLKKEGFFAYLETNSTLPDRLDEIKEFVDVISADIKLPSAAKSVPLWEKHRIFLEIALSSEAEVFTKAVITEDTDPEDIDYLADFLSAIDSGITLVLQPDSTTISGKLMERILSFQKLCLAKLRDVRIIPQMHKLLGLK